MKTVFLKAICGLASGRCDSVLCWTWPVWLGRQLRQKEPLWCQKGLAVLIASLMKTSGPTVWQPLWSPIRDFRNDRFVQLVKWKPWQVSSRTVLMGKLLKREHSIQAQPHSSFGRLLYYYFYSNVMQEVLCTLVNNRVILL